MVLISPIVGAFLLLEAAGIGGGLVSVILLPGLVAAGVGALIFITLSNITGSGTYALAVPKLPPTSFPSFSQFLWALGIGLAAAVLGTAIRRVAFQIQPTVAARKVLLTPVYGLAIAGLAIVFAEVTGKSNSYVLFSGESSLAPLVQNAATWSVGALVLLVLCKSLAYSASLSAFRGGPTFPGMFIGAAGGIALSHLPGLPVVAGVGMGMGALTVVMLRGLPLSAVLLTLAFLQSDAVNLVTVVIIAVATAFVGMAYLQKWEKPITSAPEVAEADVPT
jgi:hypothetical protein